VGSYRAPMDCCRGQSVPDYFLAAIDKAESAREELNPPHWQQPPAPGTRVNYSRVHNRYMQIMHNNMQ
jgi:hypothetical protein